MSKLNQLSKITTKSHKRVGRGYGSGKGGHTSGKGTKGQSSRAGGAQPLWFEGGQLPIIKRMPMLRGKARFNSLGKVAEVTLSDLNKMSSEVITLEALKLEKVISKKHKNAKIINTGKINRAIEIKAISLTTKAKDAILKAGGKITE